jgi:hypothetical protein
MNDEFKQAPIDQVRNHIQQAQQAEVKYQMAQEKLRISAYIAMPDGERRELVEKSLLIKAWDEKHRAEDLLEVAHAEIKKLMTIIDYLEAKNGKEGTVQMGSGACLPIEDGRTSPVDEAHRDKR